MLEIAHGHFFESQQVNQRTADLCLESIVQAAKMIATSLRRGGKLLICGNGGSAADSQHLAGEFVSVLDKRRRRPGMAALALTTDSSILTAISNDFGYDGIFERQIEALGKAQDVLLGISTSGNSMNIVRAFKMARKKQLQTVLLTGSKGGVIKNIADLNICVPSGNTQHIQESNLVVEHLLCRLTELELYEK